jgi:drug/metabolite transporter (DMT)-like permease
MAAAIFFATLSALSSACGAVLQRLAVVDAQSTTARPRWRTVVNLVRQPAWLLGALFLVGTFGFQALALYFGPLAVVQPVLVLELIFALGLRVFFLHDDIAPRTWSAALMICVGLAAFLVAAAPGEGSGVPDARQWLLAVGTRGLAVAALLLLARRGSPGRRAALFGAATAVVWSVDAAFVKQSVDVLASGGVPGLLTNWAFYAMVATGVLGTVLLQGAYAAGPLAASHSALLIVDPLASIALGAELFHEQLRTGPGYLLGAVLSLAILAAGVIMLSVWAPPEMTPESLDRLQGAVRREASGQQAAGDGEDGRRQGDGQAQDRGRQGHPEGGDAEADDGDGQADVGAEEQAGQALAAHLRRRDRDHRGHGAAERRARAGAGHDAAG